MKEKLLGKTYFHKEKILVLLHFFSSFFLFFFILFFILSLAVKCCMLYIKVTTLYLYIYCMYGKRHADTPSAPFDIGNHYIPPTTIAYLIGRFSSKHDFPYMYICIYRKYVRTPCNNNPHFLFALCYIHIYLFIFFFLLSNSASFWFRDYCQEKALLPSQMKFLSYLSSYSFRETLFLFEEYFSIEQKLWEIFPFQMWGYNMYVKSVWIIFYGARNRWKMKLRKEIEKEN